MIRWAVCLLVFIALAETSIAQDGKAKGTAPAKYSRKADVIYGRKHGMALTLDVITPEKANGLGVIWAVSGGWFSDHRAINPGFVQNLLDRGYTVFAVVHGSQPKFTIPEVVDDMRRSVRFIRHHSKDYKIDPDRLGVVGGSAGGHLSLMLATTGADGNAGAPDPVDRQATRVKAIACFFPPTDFLNYGKTGEVALGRGVLKDFRAPFDFQEWDAKTKHFVPIEAENKLLEIGKAISPVYHVTKDDAPALIVHGDADKLVPIQQAELIIAKYKEAGVPAKLVVKPGAAHGWLNIQNDLAAFADWFDEHLKGNGKAEAKRS